MSLSLDELISTQTSDEIKAGIYSTLETEGIATTSWQSGSPLRTIIALVSELFGITGSLVVLGIKLGFLDFAEGDWLRLLATSMYDVTPIEATFASTDVTIDNGGGGLYIFDPGDVVFKNSTTGKTYTNAGAFTVNPLETGVVTNVRALEIGTDSNAAPGQIDSFVTTFLGLTVTNAFSAVAVDAESDVALRQRCRDSLGALSPNGPRSAYDYVAKTPELNGGVTITRTKILTPPGDGTLTLVIAGPAGAVSGGDVALVQDGIDNHATPETVTVTVESADSLALTIVTDVYVSTSANMVDSEWQDLIKAKLLGYVPTIPIGGIELTPGVGQILWRAIIGQIEDASAFVFHATLTPETDLSVTLIQVATLAEGDITVNVHQVSP